MRGVAQRRERGKGGVGRIGQTDYSTCCTSVTDCSAVIVGDSSDYCGLEIGGGELIWVDFQPQRNPLTAWHVFSFRSWVMSRKGFPPAFTQVQESCRGVAMGPMDMFCRGLQGAASTSNNTCRAGYWRCFVKVGNRGESIL